MRSTEQDKQIGRRIMNRRRALGMHSRELAAAIGVSYQQVLKYESGRNRISAVTLAATAKALNVDIAHFFDEYHGCLKPFRLTDQCHRALELVDRFSTLSLTEQTSILELLRTMRPALPKPERDQAA